MMQIVSELNDKVRNALTPLIDSDYILLDVPYYSNIGDTLIWQGTEDLLKTIPYKCLYRASIGSFEYKSLPKDVVILLLGGGNWSDMYYHHNEFRNKIIELYPNNKIIILPQTIYYKGASLIRKDAAICRKHKQLFICARDKYGFDFLKKYNFSKNILLVPDMAFCINIALLVNMSLPANKSILLFKRIDKEQTNTDSVIKNLACSEYDVSDWPLYQQSEPMVDYIKAEILKKNNAVADAYAYNTYLPSRVRAGVELISQYNTVISNRLHGAILSILLDKKVTIIDNSYGKNAQFYDTWLRGTEGIKLIRVKHSFCLNRFVKQQVAWILTVFDRMQC